MWLVVNISLKMFKFTAVREEQGVFSATVNLVLIGLFIINLYAPLLALTSVQRTGKTLGALRMSSRPRVSG